MMVYKGEGVGMEAKLLLMKVSRCFARQLHCLYV